MKRLRALWLAAPALGLFLSGCARRDPVEVAARVAVDGPELRIISFDAYGNPVSALRIDSQFHNLRFENGGRKQERSDAGLGELVFEEALATCAIRVPLAQDASVAIGGLSERDEGAVMQWLRQKHYAFRLRDRSMRWGESQPAPPGR